MVVGLCRLQTLFSPYEQFISVLWKVFFLDNDRNSQLNSALLSIMMELIMFESR